MATKNISVIGLGYVGLPLALLSTRKGFNVVGIDLDEDKVNKINRREDPIKDEYVTKYIKKTKLKASTSFESIKTSSIIIVCVPTPVKNNYLPDLSPLKSAIKLLSKNLAKGSLLIIESTINPGVCEEVLIPIIESSTHLKVNEDFRISHCPERINPGDKKWSVENIPRVVGSSNLEGLKETADFYRTIIDAPIKAMSSIKEAEAVKIVENSFRDINIAFVNELAMSFTALGINVKHVIDGAATKPFSFMPHYPSIGVGGHCIPVDPYYLIEYARGNGFEHEFLTLARNINNHMPEFTVDRLIDGLNDAGFSLKGTKVTVLGLSYKPNVADDRESPSYKVIAILKEKGAKVVTFDPYLLQKSSAKTLEAALQGTDAIVLASNHDAFKNIDFQKLKVKVFVDGKNAYDPEDFKDLGIIYRGIGT